MKSFYPVILCGGSGTRLWPLSRTTLPKQFLPLISSRTMLQETALLFSGQPGFSAPILVCSAMQRFLAAGQVRDIGVEPFVHLLEPIGRNTAPAVAAAAFAAMETAQEAILLVLPSDLLIGNVGAFRKLVAETQALAARGRLITFGIKPTSAETGYGYIRRGAKVEDRHGVFDVDLFVNKPDAARATEFVRNGGYLWNSGMFVFKASRYLEELGKYRRDILDAAKAAWNASTRDLDFVRLDEKAFLASPAASIDNAVFEKTDDAVVAEADIGWSDIGSWKTLAQAGQADFSGNVVFGDVHVDSVRNCYVRAQSRLTAAVGVENLIIVETADAVLITHKDRSQAISQVVHSLKATQRDEYVVHKRVYSAWGYCEELDAGESFRVMHIMIKPGSNNSLRAQSNAVAHWVVVSGTVKITRGEEVLLLSENESTYMPTGSKRRLENVGGVPLHMIEVQSGVNFDRDGLVLQDDDRE